MAEGICRPTVPDNRRDWQRLQLVLEEEQYRALPAEDLLGRYLNDRDERAFAALVRRYGRLVMARCREVLRREDLAQEAFQETYTQLVVNGHAVKKRGAVGRWLARTARRRSLNVARRERRQRGRDLSTPRPVAASDPASMLDAQDSGRAIAHALSALPERLRLPIELVYLDGHTHAEAAAALDWPKGTVDSYIRRGLARLKPILARTGIPAIALGAANLPMRAEAVPPDWIVRSRRRPKGRSSPGSGAEQLDRPAQDCRHRRSGRVGGQRRRGFLAGVEAHSGVAASRAERARCRRIVARSKPATLAK